MQTLSYHDEQMAIALGRLFYPRKLVRDPMSKILKLKPLQRARLIQVMNHIILCPETWMQKRWHCGTSHCFCGWGQVFANDVKTTEEFDYMSWGREHFGLPRDLAIALFEANNKRYELYRCVQLILAGGYDENGLVLNEDFDKLGFLYRTGLCPAGYTREGNMPEAPEPITIEPIDHEDHDDCMGQLIMAHNMIVACPKLLYTCTFNEVLMMLYPVLKNRNHDNIAGYLDIEEWHITALNDASVGLNVYMLNSLVRNILREYDQGESFDHQDPERPYDLYFFDKMTGYNDFGFDKVGLCKNKVAPMRLITLI